MQNGLNNNQYDDEHYRQISLAYDGFSQVRLYHQTDAESTTIRFHLIVPEEDLCTYEDDGSRCRKPEKMEALKCIAIQMWERMELLAIQTEWEWSDTPPITEYIKMSADVQVEPFAIVKKSLLNENLDAFQTVKQGGVLIEHTDNWFYV